MVWDAARQVRLEFGSEGGCALDGGCPPRSVAQRPGGRRFRVCSLNARESGGKVVRVDSARTLGEPPTRLVMANWRRKLEPYRSGPASRST